MECVAWNDDVLVDGSGYGKGVASGCGDKTKSGHCEDSANGGGKISFDGFGNSRDGERLTCCGIGEGVFYGAGDIFGDGYGDGKS